MRDAIAAEQAVRIGDVFALLVEYYHAEGNMQQSYVLIEKMQERKIIINPYLDTELVRRVDNCMQPMHAQTSVLDSPGFLHCIGGRGVPSDGRGIWRRWRGA